MTIGKPPRLSIGLPVYNGERYLRFALDSILSQTYKDFELIISDNASTDTTKLICQEYAARDPRIRYFRNLENVGAAENFNLTFELAKGVYFKWAAADDVLSPTFLEECVNVLDDHPDVVLAYSKVNRINPGGEIDGVYDYEMRVNAPAAHTRFHDLIMVNHFCIAVFGVVRREVLARTPLIAKFVGSDRTLLAEIGLRGKLCEVPAYLFHRRDHPQASTRLFPKYNRLIWFDPSKSCHLNLIYWRVGFEYVLSVLRVQMPLAEKLQCLRTSAQWFTSRRRQLSDDIKAAILQVLPFTRFVLQFSRKSQNNTIK